MITYGKRKTVQIPSSASIWDQLKASSNQSAIKNTSNSDEMNGKEHLSKPPLLPIEPKLIKKTHKSRPRASKKRTADVDLESENLVKETVDTPSSESQSTELASEGSQGTAIFDLCFNNSPIKKKKPNGKRVARMAKLNTSSPVSSSQSESNHARKIPRQYSLNDSSPTKPVLELEMPKRDILVPVRSGNTITYSRHFSAQMEDVVPNECEQVEPESSTIPSVIDNLMESIEQDTSVQIDEGLESDDEVLYILADLSETKNNDLS
jgi:hypothetical protein